MSSWRGRASRKSSSRAHGLPDVGGAVVPVIDVADLIIAKVLAGRPKDLDDARALWRIHGDSVDASRIRAILRLLEEALSQRDLVPAFEAIAGPRR
jgi:hypothetical protein